MKKYLTLIVLMISVTAISQVDRRMRQMHQNNYYKPKKQKEKVDYAEHATNKLKEELSLDAFQEAIISDLLKDANEAEAKVMAEETPREAKIEKITAMREKLGEKIKAVLNPEQIEKFDAMSKRKKKK